MEKERDQIERTANKATRQLQGEEKKCWNAEAKKLREGKGLERMRIGKDTSAANSSHERIGLVYLRNSKEGCPSKFTNSEPFPESVSASLLRNLSSLSEISKYKCFRIRERFEQVNGKSRFL